MHYFLSNDNLNNDITFSILNQSDVQSLVSLSKTCHSGRKYACLSLANQFTHLINFCKKNCESNSLPTLEKRICAKWINIKSLLDLQSIEHTGCFQLKMFKEAFDLLKMFFKIIPSDQQQEVLKLQCPSLISEMISGDDDDVWMKQDTFRLRFASVAKELIKIGLFEQENPSKFSFKPICGRIGASFFNEGTFWQPNLIFASYKNFIEKETCLIPFSKEENLKWVSINNLYSKFITPKDGMELIPLSGFKIEWKEKKDCYENIYSHVKKLPIFFSEIGAKHTERLKTHQHCFRYSEKERDFYGNKKIVISLRTLEGKLFHSRLAIENLKSVEEFDSLVYEILHRSY